MASPSESGKKSSNKKSKASRAGLPFEPQNARKRSGGGAASEAKGRQEKSKPKSAKKSNKSKDSTSTVSAKAQARVEEIRAMNRRRAEKSEQELSAKGNTATRSKKKRSTDKRSANSGAIPEAVSRRMLRRMAVLSGSPVFLGVGVFFLAYYLQSHEIVTFPPVVVLLATMGCFGLGVLGLTYGVLSASWDIEPGSLIGLSEFKLNFGRVMDARRASKT